MPANTGGSFGMTAEASCATAPNRIYLLVEKVPDVDPMNPHPAYYVKARVDSPLRAGGSSSQQVVLGEPVGLRAEFFIISVNEAQYRYLQQNPIRDNGVLELPLGHRQESRSVWHKRGWK